MKLSILIAGILVSIASVHGGLLLHNNSDKPWMLVPGDDGKIGLAIRRGPTEFSNKAVTDPVNDVKFFLHTRSNRLNGIRIYVGDLQGSPYDGSKDTKFVVHGYQSASTSSWVVDMKDSFLDVEDCNVILVDWSGPAGAINYNEARQDVQPVGEYVGQMHSYLQTQGGAPTRSHCIGHSLGAHVCGFSGKVQSNLGRITGMDPALPLFENALPSERLTQTDANYVDIIHTCGGWLGFLDPIGHADYYPNGGTNQQPGCSDLTGDCSHGRSHDFFLESIKSNGFRARECSSWAVYQSGACDANTLSLMGYPSSTSSRGNFYLATNAQSPFAQG